MKIVGRIAGMAILAVASFFVSSCALLVPKSESLDDRENLSRPYFPEGRLEIAVHKTSVKGPSERTMVVYLPSGYDTDTLTRYPVLYLLHGARGNETAWVTEGEIMQNADSLFNAGLAEKCIIVMPNMNQYEDDHDYRGSRLKSPAESFFEIDGAVETGFVNDVVGAIDAQYRTIPDKRHRAIAGLSIGALQTAYIAAASPETFDYVGLFSPLFTTFIQPSEYQGIYMNPNLKIKQFAEHPARLFFIAAGRADIFHIHILDVIKYMDRAKLQYEYVQTKGGHDWPNWRKFSIMMLEREFK